MHLFQIPPAIKSKLTRQLYSASKVSVFISAILACILAYVQQDVINSKIVYTWLFATLLASVLRVMLVYYYLKQPEEKVNDHDKWLKRFRFSVFLVAIFWGSAGVFMFPPEHLQYQMFIIFMLAGLTAGGIASLSADLLSAIAFSVLLVIPVMLRISVVGDNISNAMATSLMLYLGFMLHTLWRINCNTIQNLDLQAEATIREEKIRASEERYRLLLSHSPVGIFHYNTENMITFCNQRFASFLQKPIEEITNTNLENIGDPIILPALSRSFLGEIGHYEGHYSIENNNVEGWISLICAPSLDATGSVMGGIAIVQDMGERKQAEYIIEHLAFYDPLTQLPNKLFLLDKLRQAALVNSNQRCNDSALLLIDLDHFKVLNDSNGHDIGDSLLKQAATRLLGCLHKNDLVARLGGDEFVVLLQGLSKNSTMAIAQAEAIGNKILATLKMKYQLNEHDYQSTASIGVTLFNAHTQSLDEMLKHADIAMYQAKKAGRNTLRFFDPQMQDAVNFRVDIERELRKALDGKQFQLFYQIQVDSSYKIIGAETLIRWIHPERGFISPAEFIPLAEETGLILPIGQWVLETACTQLNIWQQDTSTQNLSLSVNVSAKQFHQIDFISQLKETIQRHSFNPLMLKLELTESLLLENIEDTIATMGALNKIGIQFSLDDFGTGYSSLQYLKRLPLTQLKIDQSFVRDIASDNSDSAIVGTIIAMAKSLDLDVIAEGVETEEQRKILLRKGCEHFQGYLFSRPVPILQFEQVLQNGLKQPD